jgi:hypothetical protein
MAVTAKIIALREAAAEAEEAVVTEEAVEQVEAIAAEPPAPQNVRTYTVRGVHGPQFLPLGNQEERGMVTAINCTGRCALTLRDATGKALITIDSGGFDSPVALAFSGALVCEMKHAATVVFNVLSD